MSINQDGLFRRKVSFAAVSNIALRDKDLSLKAKGLYALIQSYITLENFTLYKSFLINSSTDGLRSFNTAWEELKEHGYLKQFRIRDEKGFRYEYELLDEPDTETPPTVNIKLDGSVSDFVEQSDATLADTESSIEPSEQAINISNNSYEAVLQEVNKNIEFESMVADLDDNKTEYIENIRDIIVETLLSLEKEIKIGGELKNGDEVRATYRSFNSLHLMYLLNSLDEYVDGISNPKAYMMTAIYNAVKTKGIKLNFYGITGTY